MRSLHEQLLLWRPSCEQGSRLRRSYYQQYDLRRRTILRLQRQFKEQNLLLKNSTPITEGQLHFSCSSPLLNYFNKSQSFDRLIYIDFTAGRPLHFRRGEEAPASRNGMNTHRSAAQCGNNDVRLPGQLPYTSGC